MNIKFIDRSSFVGTVIAVDAERGLALLEIPNKSTTFITVGAPSRGLFTDVVTLGYKENLGWITCAGRITGRRLTPNGRALLQAQLKIGFGFGGAPVMALDGQFSGLINSFVRDEDTAYLVPAECCREFLDHVSRK